jgi:hypothetical protein
VVTQGDAVRAIATDDVVTRPDAVVIAAETQRALEHSLRTNQGQVSGLDELTAHRTMAVRSFLLVTCTVCSARTMSLHH